MGARSGGWRQGRVRAAGGEAQAVRVRPLFPTAGWRRRGAGRRAGSVRPRLQWNPRLRSPPALRGLGVADRPQPQHRPAPQAPSHAGAFGGGPERGWAGDRRRPGASGSFRHLRRTAGAGRRGAARPGSRGRRPPPAVPRGDRPLPHPAHELRRDRRYAAGPHGHRDDLAAPCAQGAEGAAFGAPVMSHLTDSQLQSLADGTLRGPEGLGAREHCEGCAECGAELSIYAALSGQLSTLRDPEPPTDFTATVLAAVQVREAQLVTRRHTLLAAIPAFALALFAIVGWALNAQVNHLIDGVSVARTVWSAVGPVFAAVRVPLGIGAFLFLAVVLTALSRTLRPVYARLTAGS